MEKIFLEILNMSLSGSLLILVVLVARFILKKAPKWISCLLWGLVAVRLLCPFSIESALSLLPSAKPVPTDIAMMPRPEIDSGIPAINQVVNPVIERNFTPAPVASANPLQIINFIAAWIWVIGIIILLAYAIVSYGLLYKKVKGSITFEDNIKLCDYIETPFILGIFKPIIYLPSGVSEEQFYHVIAHEKAHLKRLDHIWKPLGFLVLAIHWINPLVWISYVLLCKDIEMACDEKVIADFDKKSAASYSKSLLECSVGRRNILMCPLAFGEVSVKERIKHVLNYKKPSFWVICVAAIVCVVVAICFLTNPEGADVIEEQVVEAITTEAVPGIDTNDDMTYIGAEPETAVDEYYQFNGESGALVKIEALETDSAYVNLEFTPIGPNWHQINDVNGDGLKDFVIYTGMDGLHNHLSLYLTGEGKVFEHIDDNYVEIGGLVSAIDIDHDGDNEIALSMIPRVNSAGLVEYTVLKKGRSGWEKMEIYDAKNGENSFPIHILHKGDYKNVISCDGLEKTIIFDVEYLRNYWENDPELSEDYKMEVLSYYDTIYKSKAGAEVGYVLDWGMWDINEATYKNEPCLQAHFGIGGYDKNDCWGTLSIYFDFDTHGKVRILDIAFDGVKVDLLVIKADNLRDRLVCKQL